MKLIVQCHCLSSFFISPLDNTPHSERKGFDSGGDRPLIPFFQTSRLFFRRSIFSSLAMLLLLCSVLGSALQTPVLMEQKALSPMGSNWTIEGTKVFINDSNVYMSADPATIIQAGYVYFNFTLKAVLNGTVDFLWGVNGNTLKPRNLQLWINYTHTINTMGWVERYGSITVVNVTSFYSLGIANYNKYTVDWGTRNNTYLYWINYTIAGQPNHYIMAFSNYQSLGGGRYRLSGYYNNYEQIIIHPVFFDWLGIGQMISPISYNYDGFNIWYPLLDISIEKDRLYCTRSFIDVNPMSKGKYSWAAKPHSMTIQQAIGNGCLYYLDPWYNMSWTYSKKITVDHTKVNQTIINFPMLYSVVDTNLSSFAQADGDDILFVTQDNLTKYNHEIERWNSGNGTLVCWINITFLSASVDTILYMYYGNPGVGSQQNMFGTWDGSYMTVEHMPDLTTSTTKDSTINAYTGTKKAANEPRQIYAGKIDSAQKYDNLNDYLKVNCLLSTQYRSVNIWFKYLGWKSYEDIIVYDNSLATSGNINIYADASRNINFQVANRTYTRALCGLTWYMMTMTQNGQDVHIYVNGTLFANWTTVDTTHSANGYLGVLFGSNRIPNGEYLNGIVDECQISTIARNSSYVLTMYRNQMTPSTFYSTGAQVHKLIAPLITVWLWKPTLDTFYWIGSAVYNYMNFSVNHTDNLSRLVNTKIWIDNQYILLDSAAGNGTISFSLPVYWNSYNFTFDTVYYVTVNCSEDSYPQFYNNASYPFSYRANGSSGGGVFMVGRDRFVLGIVVGVLFCGSLGVIVLRKKKK